MHVAHLWLRDFRNYRTADLPLRPGVSVFVGGNGQGKTNLVEAIGYLSQLRSHRVGSDAPLVRHGCDQAIVRGELAHDARRLQLEVRIAAGGSNRALVAGRPVRSRELARYIATVFFAPEDLALVRGEPAGRRGFLDQLLGTRSPRLGQVISDYERVVRQRNTLLRTLRPHGGRSDSNALRSLEVWDERLVELGSEVIVERIRLLDRLSPLLTSAYGSVAGDDHDARIELRVTALGQSASSSEDEGPGEAVRPGAVDTDTLRATFQQRLQLLRGREIERGATLIGPHRDDAVFLLNELPARTTASHGESWSFALAVKLAAAQLVRQESVAGDPVLILDDVFAELDVARRERLATAIGGFEQVLITAAVLADVPSALTANVIRIRAGRILDEEDAA